MPLPLAIILPGFGRDFNALRPFAEALAKDARCAFAHSYSFVEAFEDLTVEATARGLRRGLEALIKAQRADTAYVIGESLGGVIALVLAQDPPRGLKGVIAVDPPLRTANLWPIAGAIRAQAARGGLAKVAATQARLALGIEDDGRQVELDHARLIARPFRTATTVITGDLPLMPVRSLDGGCPCLLSDEDRDRLHARHDADVVVLEATGHTALSDRPNECAAIVRQLIKNSAIR